MALRLRFGPAGKPVGLKSGDYVKGIEYVASIGLNAMEYEAVRGVRVSESKARRIGEAARERDVKLSMHAPYFLNFASTSEETRRKSVERLVAAVQAAEWMGAYAVVFHPGYYKGHSSAREALDTTIRALKPVVEFMDSRSIKGVWIAPETTGKTSQVGSVEEVAEICRSLGKYCRPAVDWAHIYARSEGRLVTSVDHVASIVEYFERELGTSAVKPLHTHFSRIEYGRGGEREHHTLAETDYGPDWQLVCSAYSEIGVEAVVISESPILEKDALVMKRICEEKGYI